jgi:hypothetical protein
MFIARGDLDSGRNLRSQSLDKCPLSLVTGRASAKTHTGRRLRRVLACQPSFRPLLAARTCHFVLHGVIKLDPGFFHLWSK